MNTESELELLNEKLKLELANLERKEIRWINVCKRVKLSIGSHNLVGTIVSLAGNNIPDGFIECDGRQLNKHEYNKLYNVMGKSYGETNTHFNLPKLPSNTLYKFVIKYE